MPTCFRGALRIAVAVGVIVSASVASSCGAGGAQVPDVTGPTRAFDNVVYADMAGDQRHVWVLVAGHDRDDAPLGMRVYERARQDGWKELPPIPWTTHGRGSFAIAAWRGQPCVAAPRRAPRSGDVVVCLSSAGWRSISDGSEIDRQTVGQLTADRDGLLTLVTRSEQGTRRTKHTIYRWAGKTWQRLGAPIQARSGIPAIGDAGNGDVAPDVLVESTGVTPPTRTIYRFANGNWLSSGNPIENATIGPNVSGPVTRAGTTWVAVTEAGRTPWRFSVLHRGAEAERWQKRTFNIGRGNAQGAVYPGNAGTWAIWVESLPLSDGSAPFSERIWAARVDRPIVRPISLHAGPSLGPGDLRIVDGAGSTWALYMSTTRSRGLRVLVRALPDGR